MNYYVRYYGMEDGGPAKTLGPFDSPDAARPPVIDCSYTSDASILDSDDLVYEVWYEGRLIEQNPGGRKRSMVESRGLLVR